MPTMIKVYDQRSDGKICAHAYYDIVGEECRDRDIVHTDRGPDWILHTMRNGWQVRLDGIFWSIWKPEAKETHG